MAPTALTDLPLELLLTISDYLPAVDIACLALCNHHLMDCFTARESAFDRFSKDGAIDFKDDVRTEFLTRLAHDLPPYYSCFGCLRLHPWRIVGLPYPFVNLPACVESTRATEYTYRTWAMDIKCFPCYTMCRLHFVHVQLAMRRFYHGPEFGIPVESLFSTEVSVHHVADVPPLAEGSLYSRPASAGPMSIEELENKTRRTLTTVEARICPNPPSFCLRLQELAVVRRQNAWRLSPKPADKLMEICRHINTCHSNFWDILDPLLERYVCDSSAPRSSQDQGRCQKCNTSWKLAIRDVGQKDACLVLTRWIDLGPGLDPEDRRWKCYIDYDIFMSLTDDDLVSDPRARFESDSVQANQANALSDEDLFERNISLLQRREYLSMPQVCYLTWFQTAAEAEAWEQTKRRRASRCVVI